MLITGSTGIKESWAIANEATQGQEERVKSLVLISNSPQYRNISTGIVEKLMKLTTDSDPEVQKLSVFLLSRIEMISLPQVDITSLPLMRTEFRNIAVYKNSTDCMIYNFGYDEQGDVRMAFRLSSISKTILRSLSKIGWPDSSRVAPTPSWGPSTSPRVDHSEPLVVTKYKKPAPREHQIRWTPDGYREYNSLDNAWYTGTWRTMWADFWR